MKILKMAAITLLIGSVSAAHAADFTGLGLAVEMQFNSNGGRADYTDSSDGFRQNVSLGGEQNVVGGLNLSFGYALTPKVVMQLGATVDLGKTDVYKYRDSDLDNRAPRKTSAPL